MESRTSVSRCPASKDDIIVLSFEDNKIFVENSLLIESSEYFAAMLSGDSTWQEAKERTVRLDHWDPCAFVMIIRCLRNKTPITSDISSLFKTIHYFAITPLYNACIEYKIAHLSNENVFHEFEFAEFYMIRELQDACVEYLIANIGILLEQPRKASKKLMQILLNHDKLAVANEDAVLSLIDRWCSTDGRNSHRVELLQAVRFAHLTLPAFKRCRLDKQCLEVPDFRALNESYRWSDLDDRLLSGRLYTEVHMHSVWVSKSSDSYNNHRFPNEQLANPKCGMNALVSCSVNGNIWDSLSGKYASVMMYRSHSTSFGDQLFFYQPLTGNFHLHNHHLAAIGTVLGFRDNYSPEPSVRVNFENGIFPLAPPVVVAGSLYIALVAHKEILRRDANQRLHPTNFGQLEVLQYHLGDVERPPKKTVASSTNLSWCDLSGSLVSRKTNKLCVKDDWTMLLVPSEGFLLAIDRQPATGPIIRLPGELWNDKIAAFSDMVIVQDKAYIALEFKHVPRIGMRRLDLHRTTKFTSVIVCDLVEGKFLQKIDLSSICSERAYVPRSQEFELYLREIQNEIFLLGFTRRMIARKNGGSGALGFAYRLQLSADELKVVPIIDDFNINEVEFSQHHDGTRNDWEGRQISVDAHLCKNATVLQHEAREESDPIRLEKLRKFTW